MVMLPMAGDIFVSDDRRLRLQVILKQLGMRQLEVAEAVGVSATAISRFLSNGPDRINLTPDNHLRLVEGLKKRLAECRTIKTMKPDELVARRKRGVTDKERDRSKALVAAALALTSDSIKACEIVISELLVGDPLPGSTASQPILATPGGALGGKAANYVRRPADKEMEEILKDGRSPSSVVIGPIQGGTSSFLQRVYQHASEMRDCWARIVHFEAAFAQGEKFTQLDLFRFLFREIGVTSEALNNDSLDVHEMKDAFDGWAKTAWGESARIVMVIDGLDEIFRNAGAQTDPLALTNWFQALRNRTGGGQAPYNKLALFVALTGATWSAAHASPYATQAGALELNKFTPQELADAFKQLDVDIDEQGIGDIYSLFHGHPYLSQVFAWSMRSGSSQQAATQAALNVTSRYEYHWERMKSEIKSLVGDNFTLGSVLATVAKVVAQPGPQPLSEIDDVIWRSYRRGLHTFGLVDGSYDAPTVCQFYWAAIKKELT
jgi:transcriptional regulator with XRE-family HTH domain